MSATLTRTRQATAMMTRSGRSQLVSRVLADRMDRAGTSRIEISDADGESRSAGENRPGVPVPRIQLHSAMPLWRGATNGLIGWAESYMAEEWSCADLYDVTQWALANEAALDQAFSGSAASRGVNRLLHRLQDNTKTGSRRNISYHYDLGNAFYQEWLDPSMTYSAGRFTDSVSTLQDAQTAKYQQAIDWAEVTDGGDVLEIGCGWGGLAEQLLGQKRVDYHGVTLSAEQLDYARARVDTPTARFELRDYRDLDRQYDSIVSIEMLEAVGERFWATYFDTLQRSLTDDGTAVIQVITINDDRFDDYREGADFIQRYIFPGGMLPCDRVLREQTERAGFDIVRDDAFGEDYARTLAIWRASFESAWPRLRTMGFDERFRRMWRWYLCYCESGFRAGSIDVRMIALKKKPR